MIKLYGFGKHMGVIDPSPFVLKVDTFLRMAGLPYEMVIRADNLKHAPKKKLPYVEYDGNKVADSYFILRELTQYYGVTLDDHLSEEQASQFELMSRAIDESLYWSLVYSRWVLDEPWAVVKETFFGPLPAPVRWLVPNMVRKDVIKTLYRQGTGRHSKDEILLMADRVFSSLSVLLAENSYFSGERVCSFDATAYGMLAEFISCDLDNEFNQLAKKYENLVLFCQRVEKELY